MIKFIAHYIASEAFSSRSFQQWFISEHAPAVLKYSPRLRRYIVNLVDVPCSLANAVIMPGFDRAPAFDVIAEMWFDSREDVIDPARRTESAAASARLDGDIQSRTSRVITYRVREATEMDRPIGVTSGRTDGVKFIANAAFHERFDDETFVRLWDAHVAPTCENLRGLARYRRNWIEEAMTADAPTIRGTGEMHFESLFDAEHIPLQDDVDDLIDRERTVVLHCSEYVLRA